jgi:hypothetical protein
MCETTYDCKESYHDPVKVAATISFEVVTKSEKVLEIYLIDNMTIVQISPYRTTSKLMPPDCFIIAVDGGKEHITLPFCNKSFQGRIKLRCAVVVVAFAIQDQSEKFIFFFP